MSGVIIEDTIENFYRVNHIFVKKEIGIHSNWWHIYITNRFYK
jgi:Tfp pilus assembly ATPase PilU